MSLAQVKIVCLVDDSPSPGYRAEHGIAFFLESRCLRMLFDTGQSGDVLLANADRAGIDLGWLGLIALSHGHYDHTGGLMKALGRSGTIRLLAGEGAFHKKYVRRQGELKSIGIPFSADELWHHCDVVLRSDPTMICDCIWTTGAVPRAVPFEQPDPNFLEGDGALAVDQFRDDQSLVVDSDAGLMLLCGCCHAGLVNTMEHVRKAFGRYPSIVAGGLHLEKAADERIAATVAALKAAGVSRFLPGHCSGKKIAVAAAAAGIEVVPLCAGMRIA